MVFNSKSSFNSGNTLDHNLVILNNSLVQVGLADPELVALDDLAGHGGFVLFELRRGRELDEVRILDREVFS